MSCMSTNTICMQCFKICQHASQSILPGPFKRSSAWLTGRLKGSILQVDERFDKAGILRYIFSIADIEHIVCLRFSRCLAVRSVQIALRSTATSRKKLITKNMGRLLTVNALLVLVAVPGEFEQL